MKKFAVGFCREPVLHGIALAMRQQQPLPAAMRLLAAAMPQQEALLHRLAHRLEEGEAFAAALYAEGLLTRSERQALQQQPGSLKCCPTGCA